MQLRVARLCLDCEELHSDNRCPRCASARYAFLSTWLPSEERRRWRRPPPASDRHESGLGAVARVIARWFHGEGSPTELAGPSTRRSDLVANMTFEEPTLRSHGAPVEATDRTSPTTPGR
jgi:hypothetical protein